MNRRDFFLKTLQATAAGILVPEHLLKGRSMVSLCGIETEYWGIGFLELVMRQMREENRIRSDILDTSAASAYLHGHDFIARAMVKKVVALNPSLGPLTTMLNAMEKA